VLAKIAFSLVRATEFFLGSTIFLAEKSLNPDVLKMVLQSNRFDSRLSVVEEALV